MPTPTDSPDPAALLERFYANNRDETAFATLVQHYGRLVYTSALRRTRDPGLAEEVAQNVFAILARKAPTLRKHPALTAWIFRTTSFESSKANRSEKRRRLRQEEFARRESTSKPTPIMPTEQPTWQDALPALDDSLDKLSERERNIVLQRFFDEKKFHEIAAETGRSEAACKMQLKRSMNKLARLLNKRGVTLTGTAIATGLTTEFARAAPAHIISTLAPKAIATSAGVSLQTIAANTVYTMSTFKTVAFTAAAVLALAAIPIAIQEAQASRLRSEIAVTEPDKKSTFGVRLPAPEPARAPATRHIVRGILAGTVPADADSLIRAINEATTTQDILAVLRIFIPLSSISPEDYAQLLAALEAHPAHPNQKKQTLQMLARFTPPDPADSLERMVKMGVPTHSYTSVITRWGKTDPESAYTWYQKKLHAGAFASKSISGNNRLEIFRNLVEGIALGAPDRAIEIFFENIEDGPHWIQHTCDSLGKGLTTTAIKTKDRTHLDRFLEDPRSAPFHKPFVNSAARAYANAGDRDTSLALIDRHITNANERMHSLVSVVHSDTTGAIAERGDWILAHLPIEQHATAIKQLAGHSNTFSDLDATRAWIETLPSGAARDAGRTAVRERAAGTR